MIIRDAKFITSGTKLEHYPDDNLPEVLLAGRSNVGKSTFINSVLNRKNIAHVSGRPGKTQTLNYYLVNEAFYFVDVPGYGYARVSKKDRETFGVMIEEYLINRKQLRIVIQLVDFRHKPSEDDVLMYQFLSSYGIPTIVVGTKVDKVPKTQRAKHEKLIIETLKLEDGMFLPYSGVTKINLDQIYELLDQIVGE
ncbi:putative GTP-binding protein EngB [Candidatus Izimaplasma bacterium HR1]|jgi:GTP-binding protein|uniref:ribosome biogenesis GTP-binding protein YihA/YsxC n=1 Tax=Candidatus Izimoplasma sp. HR1 TaxID=1541959 RepID=UPI0004F7A947|nr:putative GTP-binding protein EngB [Candidatus Izimaplasma bacterium HR1]